MIHIGFLPTKLQVEATKYEHPNGLGLGKIVIIRIIDEIIDNIINYQNTHFLCQCFNTYRKSQCPITGELFSEVARGLLMWSLGAHGLTGTTSPAVYGDPKGHMGSQSFCNPNPAFVIDFCDRTSKLSSLSLSRTVVTRVDSLSCNQCA